jgi:hypothetical protein
VLHDEAGLGRGRKRLGKHGGDAPTLVRAEVQLDRVKILEAEASTEDGRVGEVLLRSVGQPGGAALDQRAHGGRKQTVGVPGERPHAIDLLDHPAEHVLDELCRLQLREPLEPEAAHHAHPLHVGDERHGLADLGQFFRASGEPEKDRQVGVGADDVAEHPHAVLVGPLEIVDEQCDRLRGRQRADGNGGQIEHAKELVIG